jgi:hypothetical protein
MTENVNEVINSISTRMQLTCCQSQTTVEDGNSTEEDEGETLRIRQGEDNDYLEQDSGNISSGVEIENQLVVEDSFEIMTRQPVNRQSGPANGQRVRNNLAPVVNKPRPRGRPAKGAETALDDMNEGQQ